MNLLFFRLIDVLTKKGRKTAKVFRSFLGWYLNQLKKILILSFIFSIKFQERKHSYPLFLPFHMQDYFKRL